MIHVGGYHEYRGGVQYRRGYHLCNLSTVGGYHQACRGYREYRGDTQITKGCILHGTEHSTVLTVSSTVLMISPRH